MSAAGSPLVAAIAVVVGIGVLGAESGARADASAPDRTRCGVGGLADAGLLPPAPEMVSAQRPLEAEDLALKKEGTYVTPIPLFNSDPDTGWGFGAEAFIYWDGPCTNPLFRYTPYQHSLAVQIWATTNGYQQHELIYDAPYLFGTPFRLRANAYYERNTSENYFGRGTSTLDALSFAPMAGRTYGTFAGYSSALTQVQPGNVAYPLYNKYDLQDPTLHATLERSFFGGRMRLLGGFALQDISIRDFSGNAISEPTGTPSVHMGTTRLAEDCAAGRIIGCAGGWNNTLKAGIAYDTRDYEPDPNRGVFAELTSEASNRVLGSSFDYARVTASARGFYSPFAQLTDLVLAGRLLFSAQTDGTPFFAMNTLTLTDGDPQGLGGASTLRGFHQDRFVGPLAALATGEVRWTFVGFHVLGESLALQAVPFVEGGRVYDRFDQLTEGNWKVDAGAGLHILWDKSTVIVFDYGVSTEEQALYINFGEQF